MENAISSIVSGLSDRVTSPADTYTGDDGLLHCSVCNRAVQCEVEFLGVKKTVRCICDCIRKERERDDNARRIDEIERRRKICFSESNMTGWAFANDDGQNKRISDAMKNYVENFADFRRDGKGLLLYGTVGTGKTFFAACIANALIDRGHRVLMTNFARLSNQIQATFDERQEYIDSLNRYALLIIDDLGAERKSEYMQEMVFNIIDARYRAGLPMIITTNLTASELKKPQEIGFSRIYDRILERCFPVEISGKSRRRQNLKNDFEDVKNKLGL